MELADRLAIARGERPADVVLTNLQLVNVFTGEIYPTEIAIAGTHIVGVGEATRRGSGSTWAGATSRRG